MRPMSYAAPTTVDAALDALASQPGARFLGGGTNLVDLVREGVATPDLLVDVTRLPLTDIEVIDGGGLRIGAGVRNTDLAAHPVVRERYPVLSQAILMGATGQIRNMATVGGNLLQRTRCLYFFDTAAACNKREPGAGCDAREGFNRVGAILGASESCVAVHPSDMAVALRMLDASVEVVSTRGARTIAMSDFHRLPGDTPDIDTTLAPDELITALTVPHSDVAATSRYRKVRDRASYAFALISVAAALKVEGDTVRDVRLALGGVAHKPWRAAVLEEQLVGGPATDEAFLAAAHAELAPAVVRPGVEFKPDLAARTITATLRRLRDHGGAA